MDISQNCTERVARFAVNMRLVRAYRSIYHQRRAPERKSIPNKSQKFVMVV